MAEMLWKLWWSQLWNWILHWCLRPLTLKVISSKVWLMLLQTRQWISFILTYVHSFVCCISWLLCFSVVYNFFLLKQCFLFCDWIVMTVFFFCRNSRWTNRRRTHKCRGQIRHAVTWQRWSIYIIYIYIFFDYILFLSLNDQKGNSITAILVQKYI